MRLGISRAGALLWSLLYLLLDGGELLSLLAAVAAHEAGHFAVLAAEGARPNALWLTGTGLRIDYSVEPDRAGEMLAALAGPVAGLLWCAAAHFAGFELSASLSLALSLFHLLPLSPLDGGRALRAAVGRSLPGVELALCAAAMGFGLWCAARGFGSGAAIAAGWLSIYTLADTCKSRPNGIK